MKISTTTFARWVIYLVGIAALAVCFILIPELLREESVEKPIDTYLTYTFLTSAYIIAAPFFIALYQTLKLLHSIEKNKIFSKQSINILSNIKICSVMFSIFVALAVIAGVLLTKNIDPTEDITFVITFGGVFIFTSSIITVFVGVLQKLLIDATSMKSENELTI